MVKTTFEAQEYIKPGAPCFWYLANVLLHQVFTVRSGAADSRHYSIPHVKKVIRLQITTFKIKSLPFICVFPYHSTGFNSFSISPSLAPLPAGGYLRRRDAGSRYNIPARSHVVARLWPPFCLMDDEKFDVCC